MAKKTLKSNLLKKLGTAGKKSVAAHKDEEIVLSAGGDLPEGIDHGIAQLVDCKFDTYKKGDNKGEFFFLAAGIVVEPKKVGKITIEGLRTQIMEPMCDTPNRSRPTIDDHVQWVLNELRKLGVDTTELDFDLLEEVAEALKEEKPYFSFRTWKGEPSPAFPNPRVNHDWRGVTDFVEEDSDDDVIDETEDDEDEVDNPDDNEEEKETDSIDLIDLGEKSDNEDTDAQSELTDLAEAVGLDAEDYETWSDLAKDLESKGGDNVSTDDEDEDEDAEDKTITPEKGEVYGYKPPKKRKPIDCTVTGVFPRKETCNLKSLDDGKIFKSVPFAKLIEN